MTRQSQEKKGRIGLCLCNKKAFEAKKWFDGELISGAMCSRFSSIRGSFLEFCWGGCCHWQGRAGSIYWDCQTSQKQKWSPSGDVTTFESFGFCTKASFTIYVGRRWSLRIKIGIKEGIIRLNSKLFMKSMQISLFVTSGILFIIYWCYGLYHFCFDCNIWTYNFLKIIINVQGGP